MANWEKHPVDLSAVLSNSSHPRAKALSDQLLSSNIQLDQTITVEALRNAALFAASSAERSDWEFLLTLVSPVAVQQAATGRQALKAGTDQYNPDLLLIDYVALGRQIALPGALGTFDDSYRPTFRREEVYGRMDPIVTYQGTTRNMALEWEMNIASAYNPELSLAAFQDLIKFMYPVYQGAAYNQLGTGTLVSPPVLRISSPNLGFLQGYNQGILCVVDSFSYSRFVASTAGGELNIVRASNGENTLSVRPTHLTIQLALTILHEESKVGFVYSTTAGADDAFSATLQFGQGHNYPYGFGTTLDLTGVPPSRLDQRLAEATAARTAAGEAQTAAGAAQADAASARLGEQAALEQNAELRAELRSAQGGPRDISNTGFNLGNWADRL